MQRPVVIGAVLAASAIALSSCATTSSSADSTTVSSAPLPSASAVPSASATTAGAESGKPWLVDTSGWWVPEDPAGCLTETTTCPMTVWKTREYKKGNMVINLVRHGETVTLLCKAPTPVPIRNSKMVESTYVYYIEYKGQNYWAPDVYFTLDDIDGMADGVPDCTSDTPGING